MSEIALFPLNTVLFPGGALPLRIFETRYIDMVSRCMKGAQGFGVCLIQEGHEAGKARMHRGRDPGGDIRLEPGRGWSAAHPGQGYAAVPGGRHPYPGGWTEPG